MKKAPKEVCTVCGAWEDPYHVQTVRRISRRDAALSAAVKLMEQDPMVLAEVVQRHRVAFAPLLETERGRLLREFHRKSAHSHAQHANKRKLAEGTPSEVEPELTGSPRGETPLVRHEVSGPGVAAQANRTGVEDPTPVVAIERPRTMSIERWSPHALVG